MKKVLVTGASGTVGLQVIRFLLSEGKYEITALELKNKHNYKRLKAFRKRINIVYGDVNDDGIVLAHRTIGRDVIRKAYFLLSLYITLIIIALFIFLVVEPFDALDSLFEIVSAIGTVGLSVGITSQLSSVSKMVIIVLMYVGRTGPLSIYLSLLRKEKPTHQQIHYPKADIMIG